MTIKHCSFEESIHQPTTEAFGWRYAELLATTGDCCWDSMLTVVINRLLLSLFHCRFFYGKSCNQKSTFNRSQFHSNSYKWYLWGRTEQGKPISLLLPTGLAEQAQDKQFQALFHFTLHPPPPILKTPQVISVLFSIKHPGHSITIWGFLFNFLTTMLMTLKIGEFYLRAARCFNLVFITCGINLMTLAHCTNAATKPDTLQYVLRNRSHETAPIWEKPADIRPSNRAQGTVHNSTQQTTNKENNWMPHLWLLHSWKRLLPIFVSISDSDLCLLAEWSQGVLQAWNAHLIIYPNMRYKLLTERQHKNPRHVLDS